MSVVYQAVLVDWVDSTGRGEWHEPDEASELLTKMGCQSAGFLIEDKPEGIVIALGHGGLGQVLDSMAIPRAAIVKISPLKAANP